MQEGSVPAVQHTSGGSEAKDVARDRGADEGGFTLQSPATHPQPGQSTSGAGHSSEQGAHALALDLEGGRHQPQLLLVVGRVAQAVDGLQAHVAVQAAALLREGVEGELAVVFPQAAVTCNRHHRSRLATGFSSCPP